MTTEDARALFDKMCDDTIRHSLTGEFAGVFSPETVSACLAESFESLAATATVDRFLVVLAERFARERL